MDRIHFPHSVPGETRSPARSLALGWMALAGLVLSIEGSEFAFKSCIYLRCIQCHLVDIMSDSPKINTPFEDKFGALN